MYNGGAGKNLSIRRLEPVPYRSLAASRTSIAVQSDCVATHNINLKRVVKDTGLLLYTIEAEAELGK